MTSPYITSLTAGFVLILQMALAAMVSSSRGVNYSWVGDDGKDVLLRAIRRHGNLAENGGLFIVGFALLELSKTHPMLLIALCGIFAALRLLQAIGLSRANTFRLWVVPAPT
jgi:uncharacterized membrane protein YecN with MAPEG domain